MKVNGKEIGEEVIFARVLKGTKNKIEKYIADFRRKTGLKITMQSFVESAVVEKLKKKKKIEEDLN